jgi:hypothetical protein
MDDFDLTHDGLANAMQRQMQNSLEDELRARVRQVQCPDHGEAAKNLRLEGFMSDDPTQVVFTACCDAMVPEIRRALGRPAPSEDESTD